jgi:hypothetical protein
MSGPAAVNNSLPILKAPTAGAIFWASSRAASAVGTSSAAMMGLRAMQAVDYDSSAARKTLYCSGNEYFSNKTTGASNTFVPGLFNLLPSSFVLF